MSPCPLIPTALTADAYIESFAKRWSHCSQDLLGTPSL